MAESSWSVKSMNPLALRLARRLVEPPPASGRFPTSSTNTSPVVWLHHSSLKRPGNVVQLLPKVRLQVPEPATSAPLGLVKKRAMLSLQQLSPQAFNRIVTVAAVITQFAGKVNVCA